MVTTRNLFDQVRNALDYLVDAELALYANRVSLEHFRVSWHSFSSAGSLLYSYSHPDVDQYAAWLRSGQYSAILFDGSLLQITYEAEDGEVVGHRLCYFPCPYDLDRSLLLAGEPVADVVELYRGSESALRSPIRFDFDPDAASAGHPASHLTINGVGCRIACVAPIHVLRFLDFIFSHFYPELHAAHEPFFEAASWQHIADPCLDEHDRSKIHLTWDVHATATGGQLGR
jgi:hypothetical protein